MDKWKKTIMHMGAYPAALGKWVLLGGIIGVAGGVIGSLFHIGVNYATAIRGAHPWILYLLPVGGLAIVGLYKLCHLEGKGTNAIIESVHFGESVPILLVPVIFVSTVITHLCGGSAGREGAALQIGGGLGYEAGKLLHLGEKDLPLATLCGMSGVFSALFGTPLTATVFALEVISVGVLYYAGLVPCITAAMAGYALAKKRFVGRQLLFTLIVCAMALPKQVILIPLLREMSALNLYNTIWAVIFPIVGWPFGVFLMKQFSEGIPTEMLEAARIDGASEAKTFISIVLPMVKPGIGALAIFTFINSWNDYFMQLIMLSSTSNLTISLGIAKLQAENSTDFGLIMAGAALAAVPIIIIFLIFQKYFTKGIAMGAVKG